MQRIERTVTIHAPVRRVFDYLSAPANLTSLWPETSVVDDVHRLPSGGKRFRWSGKMVGVHFEGCSEDIRFKVNQYIVRQISGGLRATVSWILQPQYEDTRVYLLIEYTIPPPLLHRRTAASIIEKNEWDADLLLVNLRALTEPGIPVRAIPYVLTN